MGDLWVALEMKALHAVLDEAIGIGDALMLAQMLEPGFDEEALDETPGLGGILEEPPGIGAVAPPFMGELGGGGDEVGPSRGIDAIFDRHQHRAAIRRDVA